MRRDLLCRITTFLNYTSVCICIVNTHKKLIREVRLTLTTDQLLQMVFETVIIFLNAYLIGFLLALWPLYLALAAAGISIIMHMRTIRADYRLMQKKYPDIADAIQAFEDTLGQEGYMIEKLREDVLTRIKAVRNSDFLDYKGLYIKLSWSLCIFVLIIAATIFHVQYPLVQNVQKIPFDKISMDALLTASSDPAGYVPQIAGRQDAVAMNYRIEYDLSQQQDAEQKEFTGDDVPIMQIGSDDIFVERISAEEEEVIKEYFKQIG